MKTSEKRQIVIDSLLKKNNASIEKYEGITIITHDLSVAIFSGKSAKPYCYYRFKTTDALNNYIDEQKKEAKKEIERKKRIDHDNDEKKKLFIPCAILYSSWGYEQTNIDWYIILDRKNDFVTIQEIGSKRTYDTHFDDRGSCTPDTETKIGEPFRKKISKYASISLASYKYCSLWSGKPKSWSSYA
jgi:hypothetical protein